jgi:hypothetical protein
MLAEVIVQPVQFYDDVVRSCKATNGRIYAVVNDMCTRLGLASQMQLVSIQKDELYQGFTIWVHLHTLLSGKRAHGGRPALALDLDMVPIWLARIEANKVRADVKPKLLRYQREIARVLRDFWSGRVILDLYLMPGFRTWEQEYPWEFAERVMYLYRLPMPPREQGYPLPVCDFIGRYIRNILPKDVRRELRVLNPRSRRGHRPRSDFQHFTPTVLNDVERKRRQFVWGLMHAVDTIAEFDERIRRHDALLHPLVETVNLFGTAPSLLPQPPQQVPLALPAAGEGKGPSAASESPPPPRDGPRPGRS